MKEKIKLYLWSLTSVMWFKLSLITDFKVDPIYCLLAMIITGWSIYNVIISSKEIK